MGEITFGGLASGLDTESIITAIMDVEREPLTSLENDQAYLENETSAYSEFDSKMSALLTAVEEIDTLEELSSYSATSSASSELTATADSDASAGTYKIEVVSLAELQKDVSPEGFADSSSETLSGSLTIGETTIDYANVSLSGLVSLINDADSGVSASIINDGTDAGYRLLLSGDEAGVATEVLGSGSISIDTATNGHTRESAKAHVIIDNIDIFSTSNTITDAIAGVTLDLYDSSDVGDTLTLTIGTDEAAITQKLDDFVSAYNDIITWISEQADADWGNDSSIRSVKSKMQSLLSTQVETGGAYSSLVALGFKTDFETGKISYDSDTMSAAIEDDLGSLSSLFSGDDENAGIADMFVDYLDLKTDSYDGLYAMRAESNESRISRLDNSISTMEMRLEKREANLRAQYTALELLMSEMTSQMSYLTSISS